jgi:acetate---CoA ligase (ADP-forming)
VTVQGRADVHQFLHPSGVAIVGKLGGARLADAAAKVIGGYRQRWGENFFLVSPKGGAFGGRPVYPNIRDVPGHIDLAVLNVGPANLARVVHECHLAGVPNLLIYSSGFAETGAEGAAAEEGLRQLIQSYGMRALGPNTNTNAFDRPSQRAIPGGRVGLVTQSGNQGRPIVQADVVGLAASRWVATGNEIDLDVADFIEYFAGDPETDVIAAYVEGFRDGAKLRKALVAANDADKPVVCIKIGRTASGAAMAGSHTGHLTGSDAVVDGLFAQHGVVRVNDLDELIETAALFAKVSHRTGPNCAIYGMSGGSTTLMAELAELRGLSVPRLSEESIGKLGSILPGYLAMSNPVDNGMQFLQSGTPAERQRVLEIIASDDEIDVLITAITDADSPFTAAFIEDLARFRNTTQDVPVLCVWATPRANTANMQLLIDAGIPIFRTYDGCMRAWRRFCDYRRARSNFRERNFPETALSEDLHRILNRPVSALSTDDAYRLLDAYGIPLARSEVVTDAQRARAVAAEFGFPVVMKIASADFPHKSDAGLVKVGVVTPDDAELAFDALTCRAAAVDPHARIEGVLIQPELAGSELIVGVTNDRVLGPAVMIGIGGIFTELIRDSAVRPLPLDRLDIEEMIRSLRGFPLLDGARGRSPVNMVRLVDLVHGVATLAQSCGGRLRELDLNPVLAAGDDVIVVDALVIAGQPAPGAT